jgi:MFS family permease
MCLAGMMPPPMSESPAAPTSTATKRRYRFALYLLILINVFNYVDRQVLAAVQQPIAQEFGSTKTMMGWLLTGFLLVYMIFAPIFGWWADRYSKWKLIGFSMVLQSLASGGSGIAQGYWMLLFMRCAVGIGEAAWGPAAPALLSQMYSVEKRGKILSYFYAAIPFGSALGYVVGGAMLSIMGHWRWAFYVLMPPGVIIGLICFFMKDPQPEVLAAGETRSAKPDFRRYITLMKIPSYALNCAAMTFMTFAIGGIAFWMPEYLKVDHGLSEWASTAGFGIVAAAAGIVATIIGGTLGDRLRPRFPGSYFLVSAVGLILGMPLVMLLMITPFPYAWGVLFAAVFCLFLNTGPGNAILANVVPAPLRSGGFALNIFIIHLLGDAISPPVIGWIADHNKTATTSGLGMGFVVVSIMLGIGGIVAWLGARHLERDTKAANDFVPSPAETAGVLPKIAP